MKLLKHALLPALGLTITAANVQAADLELALSGASAAAEIYVDSGVIASGGADIRFSGLFNEDDDVMGSLGLVVRGTPAGRQPFSFGLGGQIYLVNLEDADLSVSALALGGSYKYFIPANMPVALGLELFYAPGITTSGDADSFMDFRARAEIDLLPSATIFAGFRSVTTELEGTSDDYEIDDNFHVGIRVQF